MLLRNRKSLISCQNELTGLQSKQSYIRNTYSVYTCIWNLSIEKCAENKKVYKSEDETEKAFLKRLEFGYD